MGLRIHVLTNLFPPDILGGYELLAADVVQKLRARGHQVTVVTTGTPSGERGIRRILRLSRPFGARAGRDRFRHLVTAAYNRAALTLEDTPRPDALLVMSLRRLGLEPLRVYQARGIPSVITINDDWPVAYVSQRKWAEGPWARHTWGALQPSRAVYLSDAVRRMVADAGAPLPPGIVCAQGVDMDEFARRAPKPVGPRPTLLFVGRLHPTKAPGVAIDALASLRARGVEARLVMAGAPVTHEYGRELTHMAAQRGVGAHVEWLGHVDRAKLPELYRAADVFLYPLRSEIEAQGLTYMEAMSSGVPVVGFPTAGARELLQGADVLVRAARCDGDAFAHAVAQLIADPAAAQALTDRAHTWLRANASLDRYVDVLESELRMAASPLRGATVQPLSMAGGVG